MEIIEELLERAAAELEALGLADIAAEVKAALAKVEAVENEPMDDGRAITEE